MALRSYLATFDSQQLATLDESLALLYDISPDDSELMHSITDKGVKEFIFK